MQTYTRTVHESPTRDVSERVKSSDHVDAKHNDVCYDYLDIGKKDRQQETEALNQKKIYSKAMDVRYLCDMTKSIRERIRSMCEENVSRSFLVFRVFVLYRTRFDVLSGIKKGFSN